VIDRNARAQVQLIEDLLDLSRIMAGRIRLDVRETDLGGVVREAIESVEPRLPRSGYRHPPAFRTTRSRWCPASRRLQQVIWNLLSNAIKFTSNGGRVQVSVRRANSHIEISISDTGIGISASFLPTYLTASRSRIVRRLETIAGWGLGWLSQAAGGVAWRLLHADSQVRARRDLYYVSSHPSCGK
jgi:signal transduction histidine kinase